MRTDYYEKIAAAGACFGLSEKKLMERAVNWKKKEDGIITFEMERHHPLGGTVYRVGCPMGAFVCCTYRYLFNINNNELIEHQVSEPRWDENEWDWHTLAEDHLIDFSFSFMELHEEGVIFSEDCLGISQKVFNLVEAIRCFRAKAESWDLRYCFEQFELDEMLVKRLSDRLRRAIIHLAEDKIKREWVASVIEHADNK